MGCLLYATDAHCSHCPASMPLKNSTTKPSYSSWPYVVPGKADTHILKIFRLFPAKILQHTQSNSIYTNEMKLRMVSRVSALSISYKYILSQASLGCHSIVIIAHDNLKVVVLCLTHWHVMMLSWKEDDRLVSVWYIW